MTVAWSNWHLLIPFPSASGYKHLHRLLKDAYVIGDISLKELRSVKNKFTRICSVLLKLHSGSKFIAAYILPRLEGDLWKTIEKNSSQMQLANLSALQGKKAVKCVCVGCIDLMNNVDNVIHKTCNWVPAMDVAYQYISILTYHTRRFTPSASGSLPLQVARN